MADTQNSGGQGSLKVPVCSAFERMARPSLGERAVFLKGTRWDLNSTVVIRFLEGNSGLHDLVRKHAGDWSNLTNLTFKYLGPNDNQHSDVRVAFSGAFGVQPEEFSSLIGVQARQSNQFTPTIKLGFTQRVLADERETRRLILHEFGHMVGLMHEHQNPNLNIVFDRNALLAEFSRLGWTPQMVEDNIISRFDPSQVQATGFDDKSIMLYAFDSRFANPPTHVNFEISDLDKQLIQQIYDVGGPPKPPESTAAPGIPLEVGTPSDEEFYLPVFPVLFKFKVDKEADYVMQTDSDQPWVMELLGPDDPEKLIDKDERSSGQGPNALIRSRLKPGVYFLRVKGRIIDSPGSFKVKVDQA